MPPQTTVRVIAARKFEMLKLGVTPEVARRMKRADAYCVVQAGQTIAVSAASRDILLAEGMVRPADADPGTLAAVEVAIASKEAIIGGVATGDPQFDMTSPDDGTRAHEVRLAMLTPFEAQELERSEDQ